MTVLAFTTLVTFTFQEMDAVLNSPGWLLVATFPGRWAPPRRLGECEEVCLLHELVLKFTAGGCALDTPLRAVLFGIEEVA